MKKRPDCNAMSVRSKTGVILLVGSGGSVIVMKSAYAMKARTAIFAKCIGEGETKGKPLVIGWRDVDCRGFDKRNDIFDVLKLRGDGCRGGKASRVCNACNASNASRGCKACNALRDCRVCRVCRGSRGCNACRGSNAGKGCGGRMGGMGVWGFCHTIDIRG